MTPAAAGMGSPLKYFAFDQTDLNVIARQTKRSAGYKQKTGHPARFPVKRHGPDIGQ